MKGYSADGLDETPVETPDSSPFLVVNSSAGCTVSRLGSARTMCGELLVQIATQ